MLRDGGITRSGGVGDEAGDWGVSVGVGLRRWHAGAFWGCGVEGGGRSGAWV